MAELKTTPTEQNVEEFLNDIPDENKRQDSFAILELMKRVTGAEPKMWGTGIVGLGDYHYKYASGREGDWFITGFSPRKDNLTLYLTYGFEQYEDLMKRLGKYKAGKACLYIKKIDDINLAVLEELIRLTVEQQSRSNLG